jgi:hypothetical protein
MLVVGLTTAQAEAEILQNAIANALHRKPAVLIQVRGGWCQHGRYGIPRVRGVRGEER